MDDIRKTQKSFALKALHHKEHRFEDLYHLLCREDWIQAALDQVLRNRGSRTAGIDGITRKHFENEDFRRRFVEELRSELQAGTYKPQPVRRHYIEKDNGNLRPLGIPTIKDRVVQMLLKMLLEPIWESDFLDCSSGFRPGRRTMDCIAMCYRLITAKHKYYWVIEGDIKGCFDHINHTILLKQVRRRIKDRRILALIDSFLKAGVMEGELFKKTAEGTPQGGIVSPLLANIYLHAFDEWWWKKYGGLTRREKTVRRQNGLANCRLIRYADDFILLTNGTKEQAHQLRDEVQRFLAEELHLELSMEKTHVTHVNEGFCFLGFHIRRYTNPRGGHKPVVLVKPSPANVAKLKRKIKDMTSARRGQDSPLLKMIALNRLLRGWIGYYKHVNVKEQADALDHWVYQRMIRWLSHKHKCGPRKVLAMYQHRQGGRRNLAVRNEKGELLYLYHMADQRITRYVDRKRQNPYLGEDPIPFVAEAEIPIPDQAWNGSSQKGQWIEVRLQVLERDGYRCQVCKNAENLDVHHIVARQDGGNDSPDNLITLCEHCHRKVHKGQIEVSW